MPDPFMLAIAAELAAKFLVEGGVGLWQRVVEVVRGKADQDERLEVTLAEAVARPDSQPAIVALAKALERAGRADLQFENVIRSLGGRALTQGAGAAGHSVNQVMSSSVSGDVIQAGDVYGGISMGPGRRAGAESSDES